MLDNALIKIKYTPPQADLKGRQRRENIKNAFNCPVPKLVQNKTILLIDDVTTTGATLQQAAKVLKQAGARSVWGLVIAKG
jgi:predicted amidophosphoribosyltransferase